MAATKKIDDFVDYFTNLNGLWVFIIFVIIDTQIRRKVHEIYLILTFRRNKIAGLRPLGKQRSINDLLNMSLNTEFILAVLHGVVTLAACSSDSPDNFADAELLAVEQETTIRVKEFLLKAEDFEVDESRNSSFANKIRPPTSMFFDGIGSSTSVIDNDAPRDAGSALNGARITALRSALF